MRQTDNFRSDEFLCPCCRKERMDQGFISKLQFAREFADVPFKITSGWRCPEYQKELREKGYHTANGISPHEKGVAADIEIKSDELRHKILHALQYVGFNRFGIGSKFVHTDMDHERNEKRIWWYDY